MARIRRNLAIVTPAQAGVHADLEWMPAFAGMTGERTPASAGVTGLPS
jgi:hypothetical protein